MDINYFPSTREYTQLFGINNEILDNLGKKITIMHPGPINRGVEITSDVADSDQSIILNQVGKRLCRGKDGCNLFTSPTNKKIMIKVVENDQYTYISVEKSSFSKLTQELPEISSNHLVIELSENIIID